MARRTAPAAHRRCAGSVGSRRFGVARRARSVEVALRARTVEIARRTRTATAISTAAASAESTAPAAAMSAAIVVGGAGKRGLAREIEAAFFVDLHDLHVELVADVDHVFHRADARRRELADVDETFFTGKNLHERTDRNDPDDRALVDLTDLDVLRDRFDRGFRLLARRAVERRDVDGAVVLDVDLLGAGVGMILLIILPPGPMTSLILSGLIVTTIIRGANCESSACGLAIVSSSLPMMNRRDFLACVIASRMMSIVMPWTLMSIWIAVMPSMVPATLKSISPSESSMPWMSVSTAYLSP